MLEDFIAYGSLPLLVVMLLLAGLGLPLPEDVVLLAGGVVSHLGAAPWWAALPILFVAAVAADLVIFLLARRFGEALLSHAPLRWILTPARRRHVRALFERHGNKAVFVGRHLSALRGVIFALAAIEGVPLRVFLLWDILGALITIPLVFGAGFLFSAHVELVRAELARAEHWVLALAVLVGLIVWGVYRWRQRARFDEPEEPKKDPKAPE